VSIIFEIFDDLPRQGPGDDASTRRAFQMLTGLPVRPEILDIGCGSGAQTIALAQLCPGRITAIDIHDPFLQKVQQRAEAAGVAERVMPVNMSMTQLDLPNETFDIIWREGAIFITGFREGLAAWRRLLKSGGYLVTSEAAWFCDNPPAAAKEFWDACYPAIANVKTNTRVAEDAGYRVVGTFPLPSESWWTEYYRPLEPKLPALRAKYAHDAAALAELAFVEREIEIHREYSDAYGYEFYILQKPR
jgi:ubiquinone/menaquinone biosynthesis C-methylase UbiE